MWLCEATMAEPGTLEQIALVLGQSLEPLTEQLQPERALSLLGQLGLSLPQNALTPQLRSALGAGAQAAAELPALVTALIDAIEAGDSGLALGAHAAPLVARVASTIKAFTTIADELGSLAVPGLSPAVLATFVAELPGRLLELLLVSNLQRRQPTLSALLGLLGVIDTRRENVGSVDPFHPEIERLALRLDRIGTFLSSPEHLAAELYGWGEAGFDATLLLRRLYELLSRIGFPVARGVLEGPPDRPCIEFLLARIAGTPPAVVPPGLDAVLLLAASDGFRFGLPIAPGLEFEVRVEGGVSGSAALQLQPPAALTFVSSGHVQGSLTAGLSRVPAPGEQAVSLFGVAGASGLSATRLSLATKARFSGGNGSGHATGDVGIEGRIEGGRFVISLAEADGFVGSIMGGFGLESNFDLGFGWSAGSGVYFSGSGGLEIKLPTHLDLGPVEIMGLTFRIGIEPAGLPVALGADLKADLGPLAAVVEGIGVQAMFGFAKGGAGNLGPVDLGFAFKPPKGVGLSLDVGIVKGGGYLAIDPRGEYSGALELEFAEFLALHAVGLITTKNPDATPGFSLLLIITTEFPGGLQLGYGFTLLAVGGLLGINRTMNLQALLEGVRSNAVESVMFPHDIVANAPRILSDLRAFFPAQEGTFLIGPMMKLGWGTPTLVTIAVGVIIEIPGNIGIVGVLKVVLPTEEAALLKLQVNFAGAVEFDKQRLYFFAALYDSRLLFMTLEGEMGLLVGWGDQPEFVLSVGGFHPSFQPPPLPFPSPRRMVVSILDTDRARIRVTNYFAVTSNTVQFGAGAELYFGFSSLSIEGHIAYDALFQFSPFHFIVDVSGSVSLKVFGAGVFGIRLAFELSGTSPWRAKGSGSISLLFFEVSADFDETWGEPRDSELDPVEVLPLLGAEFDKAVSWRAVPPPGTRLPVPLRQADGDPNLLVLHPAGTLEVRQRVVPLDLSIAKLGANAASDANRFTIAVASPHLAKRADVSDPFAMAQFLSLKDAEKLSRPSFERQHSGIELTSAGHQPGSARMTRRVVRYEEIVIDSAFRRRQRRFRPMGGLLFAHFLAGNSVARSVQSSARQQQLDPFSDKIAAGDAGYVLASTADNTKAPGSAAFASESAALDHMAALAAADPTVADTFHVIPSFEMSLA
jgi:hypothetical protein